MPKFFINREDIHGESLSIREDAHHILHVLRQRPGDRIVACDGMGTDYECEIQSLSQEAVLCRIISSHPSGSQKERRRIGSFKKRQSWGSQASILFRPSAA